MITQEEKKQLITEIENLRAKVMNMKTKQSKTWTICGLATANNSIYGTGDHKIVESYNDEEEAIERLNYLNDIIHTGRAGWVYYIKVDAV